MNELTIQHEREALRLQSSQEELVDQLSQIICEDGVIEPFKGIHLARLSVPYEKLHSVMEPSFCVIAQGSKEVLLGNSRFQYDPFHYLLATLELPRVSQVLEASREQPYLSFRLELDPQLVSSVMIEAGHMPQARSRADARAIDVSPLNADLLDAVVRMVRLMRSPGEARVLLPMITREIIYRLLISDQGARLRYIASLSGYTPHIARAVEILRQDFDKSLSMEQLARDVGMSVSGFHAHFKEITAMSPLQFQKQLRLQEARRLMLNQNLDAASAAYRVGYNDAAHFNREYKSLFGVPPIRDVQQLRETAGSLTI